MRGEYFLVISRPHSEVLTLEMHHYVANPEKRKLQRLALTVEKPRITRRFIQLSPFLVSRRSIYRCR